MGKDRRKERETQLSEEFLMLLQIQWSPLYLTDVRQRMGEEFRSWNGHLYRWRFLQYWFSGHRLIKTAGSMECFCWLWFWRTIFPLLRTVHHIMRWFRSLDIPSRKDLIFPQSFPLHLLPELQWRIWHLRYGGCLFLLLAELVLSVWPLLWWRL